MGHAEATPLQGDPARILKNPCKPYEGETVKKQIVRLLWARFAKLYPEIIVVGRKMKIKNHLIGEMLSCPSH